MEISEKTQKFIEDHCNDDVNVLRLKYAGKSIVMDFPIEFALLQIEARRKAHKKIPTFLANPKFIFPDSISAEQASNEIVASYHASLLKEHSTLLDLTAGLGIDDLTFAMKGHEVTACEINKTKSEALLHNSDILGLSGKLKVINVDSIEYIKNIDRRFDVIFSDPARRSATGKRLHALSDCQPDILSWMEYIMRITDRLLIKSSPLLDLTLIRDTVSDLSHIYVVCLKGECKEVLIDVEKGRDFSGVTVADLDSCGLISRFKCSLSPLSRDFHVYYADRESPASYRYLYEPNAGVMKSGAWGELCKDFPDIRKADPNTHIFFSDSFIKDFPGRTLTVVGQYEKKALKALRGSKCNVVVRNYPISAPDVAKKYALIPGGDKFLYAFRYKSNPVCLLTEQVKKDQKAQE